MNASQENVEPISGERLGQFIKRWFGNPSVKEAVWYTTPKRIFHVCRLNGLTEKRSARIAYEVEAGISTPNEVLDYLSAISKSRKRKKT